MCTKVIALAEKKAKETSEANKGDKGNLKASMVSVGVRYKF